MSETQKATVTIVSIGTATGSNDRGAWKRFDVKTDAQLFKTFNKHVGEAAEGYVGQSVEVDYSERTKDNGYTDYTLLAVRPANPAATAQKAQAAQGQVPAKVWDDKDRRIAREVCVKAVVELYAHRDVAIPKVSDMLARAEAFEKWIYRGMDDADDGGPDADDALQLEAEDIPFE